MISNPCCWFSGGGSLEDQREFIYEGGKYLYHFDSSGSQRTKVNTGWTGNYVACNVVFFADSVDHARDVFRRMLEFRLKCSIEQSMYYTGNKSSARAAEDLNREDTTYQMYKSWLGRIDEAVFTLAPTNQFFKVGWADNDNLR